MKRIAGLRGALLASGLGLMGCQTQDEARLEDSQSAWQKMLRQQGAATYSYVVPWGRGPASRYARRCSS